jgi:hypothetical protein
VRAVTHIRQRHELSLKGKLEAELFGSRTVLGPEQAAESHLGFFHELSKRLSQSFGSRREPVPLLDKEGAGGGDRRCVFDSPPPNPLLVRGGEPF